MQAGIDSWILDLQGRYNNIQQRQEEGKEGKRGENPKPKAIIHGTYQAYLKTTPGTLSRHLRTAQIQNFTLGVKLVRGAYLASDSRDLFWASKAETDAVYDGLAEGLIRREFGGVLKAEPAGTIVDKGSKEKGKDFPKISLALASHNLTSVKKAMALRKMQEEEQEERGQSQSLDGVEIVYGQLQGMADEVSCEIVQAGNEMTKEKEEFVEVDFNHDQNQNQNGDQKDKFKIRNPKETRTYEAPKAYKYLVWGSVEECLKYLLRRAEENRDAVVRTKTGNLALRAEILRRLFHFRLSS